jgi:hypothetical protein
MSKNVHLEFLVEDYSTREALSKLLPKMLLSETTFEIHAFRGKLDLLSKLPSRLQGYRQWAQGGDLKLVVLLDRDSEDCKALKENLEAIAHQAGLITKAQAKTNQPFQVINRLMIEELEAWFFGDIEALTTAYPRISATLANKEKYRDPDAIKGGTWEALEKLLMRAGYHQGGLDKVKAAREISQHMQPSANRSRSFQVFHAGLKVIGSIP